MADAAQIVPPVDGLVAAADRAASSRTGRVNRRRRDAPSGAPADALARCGAGRRTARPTLARVPPPEAPIRIATTAMHGVGGALDRASCWRRAGHGDVHPVAEQSSPDPDFPTRRVPQPRGAGRHATCWPSGWPPDGADLGLALDPDADRVAVAGARPGRRHPPAHRRRGRRPARRLAARRGHLRAGPAGRCRASCRRRCWPRSPPHHGARPRRDAHRASSGSRGPRWSTRSGRRSWPTRRPSATPIGAEVRDKDGLSAALAVASLAAAERAPAGGPCRRRPRRPARAPRRARHRQLLAARRGARRRRRGGPRWSGRLAASPPERVGRRAGRPPARASRRRAAPRPRGRRPRRRPPQRHRAEAQVLLRGRRAGARRRRRGGPGAGPGAPGGRPRGPGSGCSWPDARARSVPRSPSMLSLSTATAAGPCSTASAGEPPARGSRPLTAYALEERARPPRLAAPSSARARRAGLELAIRCIDLTTLEGDDTPGKVRAPRAPARCGPTRTTPRCPPVAAVCVYGVAGGRRARRAGRHAACTWPRSPAPSRPGQSPLPGPPRRDPRRRRRRRRRDRHRPQPRGAPGGPSAGRVPTRWPRRRRPAGTPT